MNETHVKSPPYLSSLAVFLGAILLMTTYEVTQRLLFWESLSSIESHLTTILFSATLVTMASGRVRKWASKTHASMQASGELLQDILNSVSSQIAVLGRDGVIYAVNASWQQFALDNGTESGKPARRTEIGVNYLEVCRESRGKFSEGTIDAHDGIQAVLNGRLESFFLEYSCHSPDQQRWFVMNVDCLRNGRYGAVISHTNITALKQAEAELRTLSRAVEQSPASIMITDQAGNIVYVNPFFEQVTGYTRTEVVGKNPRILKSGLTSSETYRDLWGTISKGGTWQGEMCNRNKNGELFWERVAISGLKDKSAEVGHYIAVKEDITERKRIETLNAESRNLLLKILDTIPTRVFWKDRDLRYRGCNRLFANDTSMSHPKDVIGKDDYQMVWADQAEIYRADDRAVMESGIPKLFYEERQTTPSGQEIWLRTSKVPLRNTSDETIGLLGVYEDITSFKEAEAKLEQYRQHLEELVLSRTVALEQANAAAEVAHRNNEEHLRRQAHANMQSSKLEAVGTLAAGIAHDFNNILGSIVGFAEMTSDDLPNESSTKHNVAQILNASFRARDLIARMLTFARQSPIAAVTVDVVAQVRETLALLRGSLQPSVFLSFKSEIGEASASATLLADPTQIQQVVMNLCINAAHAMDDKGTIRIGIDSAEHIKDVPPKYVDGICLTVADNGCGMTPEVLERVFEPFFTTKAPGEGSGLGLSVVYGIVTGLGGVIEVQSQTSGRNPGTEFRVFLPLQKITLPNGEIDGAHLID